MSDIELSQSNVYLNGVIEPNSHITKSTQVDRFLKIARENDYKIYAEKNLDKKVNELLGLVSISGQCEKNSSTKINPDALIHGVKNQLVGLKGYVKANNESLESEGTNKAKTELLDWLKERDEVDLSVVDKCLALELEKEGLVEINGVISITDKGCEYFNNAVETYDDETRADQMEKPEEKLIYEELEDEESLESFLGRLKFFFQDIGTNIKGDVKSIDQVYKEIQEVTLKASQVTELKHPDSSFKINNKILYGFSTEEPVLELHKWGGLIDLLESEYRKCDSIFSSIRSDVIKITDLVRKVSNEEKNWNKYIKEANDYLDKIYKKIESNLKEKKLIKLNNGQSVNLKSSPVLPNCIAYVLNDQIQYPCLYSYKLGLKSNLYSKFKEHKFDPIEKPELDRLIGDFDRIKKLLDLVYGDIKRYPETIKLFNKLQMLAGDIKKESTNRDVISATSEVANRARYHLVSYINMVEQIIESLLMHTQARISYIKFTLSRY